MSFFCCQWLPRYIFYNTYFELLINLHHSDSSRYLQWNESIHRSIPINVSICLFFSFPKQSISLIWGRLRKALMQLKNIDSLKISDWGFSFSCWASVSSRRRHVEKGLWGLSRPIKKKVAKIMHFGLPGFNLMLNTPVYHTSPELPIKYTFYT